MLVPGYELKQLLYQSERTVVYRSLRVADGSSVIIKALSTRNSTDELYLVHEYEFAKELNLESVVRPISLEYGSQSVFLVLEDDGAVSLKSFLANKELTLEEFYHIAFQIVDIIGSIHDKGIIHKDIKPENIIIHPETRVVKLIDFQLASRISSETLSITPPEILEGSLPYMSPEQTGRMNRDLDYRSDYYSLGVTFFEMLTNQLPYEAKDALEWVHAHIAKSPRTIRDTNSSFSMALTSIIEKLLKKNAENRYQSSFGIKYDLETSKREYERFPLGTRDIPSKFHIPQKMYGRTKELQRLLAAFDAVCEIEQPTLALISGYSGIGKTTVVKEMYQQIFKKQGFFLQGKYDQFKKDVPYSAIVSALTSLIKYILSYREEELIQWKTSINEALGEDAGILAELMPDLKLLIGEQDRATELSPFQNQNRFQQILEKFIKVFAAKKHPLVIFLDDLQWADSGSLALMESVVKNGERQALFLLAAYRDNEADKNHLFETTKMAIMEHHQWQVMEISLQPLSVEDIADLIQDTFHCEKETAHPLASLINQKTGGNPFFVSQLLKNLVQKEWIGFIPAEGRWHWDIDSIDSIHITDNVVELMLEKLHEQDISTQKMIHIGACIGNHFALHDIVQLLKIDAKQCYNHIESLLIEGLLQKVNNGNQKQGMIIRFVHDRVHKAAYQLFPEETERIHYQLGLNYLQHYSQEQIDQHLFTIIGHFLEAIELIDESIKIDVIQLSLKAAKRAKVSASYQTMAGILKKSGTLMDERIWTASHALAFDFYYECAESEYLCGHTDESLKWLEFLSKRASNDLEKIKVINNQILVYHHTTRFEDAKNIGIEALRSLGMSIPNKISDVQTGIEFARAYLGLLGKSKKSLLELPELTDERKLAILKLAQNVVFASMYCDQDFGYYLSLKVFNYSLKNGNSPYSGSTYAIYGAIMAIMGMPAKSEKYVDLAFEVAAKYNQKINNSLIYTAAGAAIYPWIRPYEESLRTLATGIGMAMNSGEYLIGTYCANDLLGVKLFSGAPLKEVRDVVNLYEEYVQDANEENVKIFFHMVTRLIDRLSNNPAMQTTLSEDHDKEILSRIDINDILMYYYAIRLQLLYLFGDFEEGARLGEKAQKEEKYTSIPMPEIVFYHSLHLMALLSNPTMSNTKNMWKQLEKNIKRMKKWAAGNKSNYEHKRLLLAAEWERIRGNKNEALELYGKAIKEAKTGKFYQVAAIANEAAAKYYEMQGVNQVAKGFFLEAYQLYLKWGAIEKANQLQTDYIPTLEESFALSQKEVAASISRSTTTVKQTTINNQELDLLTVMKSSEALSKEIVFDELLAKLMEILLENAGAERGAVILLEQDEAVVHARMDVNMNAAQVEAMALDEEDGIAKTIVQFVLRTQESVVVSDASQDELFRNDSYIKEYKPKSILCIPIMNQGTLSGGIYLENNLSVGAFTVRRVELLKVLSSQIAISIANARLYANLEKSKEEIAEWNLVLEEKVNARTNELQNALQDLNETLDTLKQTQDQLVESEKMSALGGLVAGVAHEINTPLGISVTATSYLGQRTKEFQLLFQENKMKKSDLTNYMKTVVETTDMIEVNLARASELVKSFKQVAVDQSSEVKRQFKLSEYMNEIILSCMPQIKTSNVQVEIDIPGEIYLYSYPGDFSQVFTNFIMNSLIHAFDRENEGHIVIKAEQIDKQLSIAYRDDGKGMTEEVVERVFEPFFTTNRNGGGTGLGMHIVYNIITQRLKGSITCSSVLEKGTEFTIWMPMEDNVKMS